MISPTLRRIAGLLAALALLFGFAVTGVHDHARDDSSHPCAICTLSHAPATAPAIVSAGAPAVHVARVVLAPRALPRDAGPAAPTSRAPPSA